MQIAAKQLDLATMQAFLPSRGTIEGKMDADLRVRGTLAPLSVAATGRLAFDDPDLRRRAAHAGLHQARGRGPASTRTGRAA